MQPRPQYLELYHGIDVGLDTFPYNGHTTSLDSFWMGVPVVTLVGQTVVGRAGLSQLTNLGLPELVGHTPINSCGSPRSWPAICRVWPALRHAARSDAEVAADGRPAFCPERRGRLPQHVAALV